MTEWRKLAIYIKSKGGWFWTVRRGNRILYFGPYRSEAEANERGPHDAAES